MLLALREKISGYIAWVVVTLISIPFVLWGIQEYLGLGQETYAVTVNDNKVSIAEFDRAIANNRQLLLQSFGGRIPSYFDANSFLRQQTLNQLINRELLESVIEKYNYRVNASQIASSIINDSRFQRDGQFDDEIYAAELRSIGFTKQGYEQAKGQEVLFTQIEQGLQSTAFFPPAELEKYATLRYQTRDFEYLKIKIADYKNKITPEKKDIEAYYNENSKNFNTEQKLKIQYLELNLADIAGDIVVNDEELEQLYTDAIAEGRYQSEETRQASHILVRLSPDASEEIFTEKKAKVESLLERLKQGEDFAELAKAESEDPGSATEGGSLGEVRKGAMVKPFEDALFSLSENMLSDPVKTQFGFHIIKVDKINKPQVQTFNEIKDTLKQDYQNRQAETIFFEKVDILSTLSFENPNELDIVAEAASLPILESDFFTQQVGNGIARHSEIRNAAFSEQVLTDKNNSELIEIGANHAVVIRLLENEISRPKTLAEASSEIEKILIQNTAVERIGAIGEEILKKASDDKESFKKLSEEYNLEYKQLKEAKRDNNVIEKEAIRHVFGVSKSLIGKADKPIEKIITNSGDVVILQINAAQDGDIQWLNDEEKQQFSANIINSLGRYDYSVMLASLKERADIIFNSEINAQLDQTGN